MLDGGEAALAPDTDGAGGLGSASIAAALIPALALAACGGSDGAIAPAPTASAPVPVTAAALTTTQASRFLAQTTMGATKTAINDVVLQGFDGWLAAQFAMPRATAHWDWLVANGYNVAANINSETGYDATVWRQLIAEPDQLRQRVAFALFDMLVVGIDGINLQWKQFAAAAYLDVLLDNAFTNYRQSPTFRIQFAIGDDRLPLASAGREDGAGVAVPAGQGPEMHLYRGTA